MPRGNGSFDQRRATASQFKPLKPYGLILKSRVCPFSQMMEVPQMKISRHTLMIFTLFVALFSSSLVYGVDGPELPIPPNLKMSVGLLSPLSTATNKKGDKFSCKILTPAEYAGSIVEGHIRNLKGSGK